MRRYLLVIAALSMPPGHLYGAETDDDDSPSWEEPADSCNEGGCRSSFHMDVTPAPDKQCPNPYETVACSLVTEITYWTHISPWLHWTCPAPEVNIYITCEECSPYEEGGGPLNDPQPTILLYIDNDYGEHCP